MHHFHKRRLMHASAQTHVQKMRKYFSSNIIHSYRQIALHSVCKTHPPREAARREGARNKCSRTGAQSILSSAARLYSDSRGHATHLLSGTSRENSDSAFGVLPKG